jgi:hypothetical protein
MGWVQTREGVARSQGGDELGLCPLNGCCENAFMAARQVLPGHECTVARRVITLQRRHLAAQPRRGAWVVKQHVCAGGRVPENELHPSSTAAVIGSWVWAVGLGTSESVEGDSERAYGGHVAASGQDPSLGSCAVAGGAPLSPSASTGTGRLHRIRARAEISILPRSRGQRSEDALWPKVDG